MIIQTETATCEICRSDANSVPVAKGWDFEYATSMSEHVVVKCEKCGLVYIRDRPIESEMLHIYPNNYYSFAETSHEQKIVKVVRDKLEQGKIIRLLSLAESASPVVLDVGCGDGRLLDLFRKNGATQCVLEGVEIGEGAVEVAKSKGYKVKCANFEAMDVTNMTSRYDLVLLHQVLEHTRSPKDVLGKINSVLKLGGVVSIETPDTNSWDFKLFEKRYWGGYHIPRHFYMFDKKNICQILTAGGFEVVSVRSMPSPVFWIHSIHNMLIDSPRLKKFARYFYYQNSVLLATATFIDLVQIKVFGTSSNMQILARKKVEWP